MLARAAAAGGSGGSERICGGTFHAIAHKIIRQHAESFSLPPQFTILDPGDTADILDVLRPDHGLAETGGQRAPRAAACADIYTRCVNTGRPVSEVVTASFPWCAPFTGAAGRPVPRLHRAQAGPAPAGLRRPAAAVAGGAGRPGGRAGAARHVRRGAGRRVPGRQRGPGQHRAAAAAGREAADLRGRRRAGHLRVPRRRPGAPAAARGRLPGAGNRPARPQLPVPAGRAGPGQPHPAVRARPGPDADRRPRPGDGAAAGPLPRRGHPGEGDLRPGAGRARGRRRAAGPGGAGPRRPSQRHPGNRAQRPQDPLREVRRPAVHRHRPRQGLPRRRADPGQPRRRPGLVPAAAAARGHRPGTRPPHPRRPDPATVRPTAGSGVRGRPGPVPARPGGHPRPARRRGGRPETAPVGSARQTAAPRRRRSWPSWTR